MEALQKEISRDSDGNKLSNTDCGPVAFSYEIRCLTKKQQRPIETILIQK